jgi:hypothetical protein
MWSLQSKNWEVHSRALGLFVMLPTSWPDFWLQNSWVLTIPTSGGCSPLPLYAWGPLSSFLQNDFFKSFFSHLIEIQHQWKTTTRDRLFWIFGNNEKGLTPHGIINNWKVTARDYCSSWVQWLMPIISATWEVKIGGSWLEASSGKKKVSETLSQRTNPGMILCVCNLSYMGGRGRKIMVWGQSGERAQTLFEK